MFVAEKVLHAHIDGFDYVAFDRSSPSETYFGKTLRKYEGDIPGSA